ncbi:magnesium transporter [bacterium]|nr:magnesium transporter [bacterium]
MRHDSAHFDQPVIDLARKDVATLHEDLTVQQALNDIRQRGIGEKIVYFYLVDADGRLTGVLPTRRLLTAPLESRLSDVKAPRVVSIPHTATVLDACEAFVLYKFLAFPLVDESKKVVGVIDISLLSDEAFDIAEKEQTDALFASIGFRISQVRDASPARAFKFRFPWLTATIGSGLACAMLASVFEATLAKTIALAFFLTLALGLGESVSIQSMTVTIQALRSVRPTLRWYLRALRREVATASLLGAACGLVVGLAVWLWRGSGLTGIVIGSSIMLAVCAACFVGLSVPSLLHALRLDPKIAAGPVTLALADILTLFFYFGLAACVL